jgi:hypothetical protein
VLAELDLMLADLETAAEAVAHLAAAGVAELLREAASGFAGRPGVRWLLLTLLLLRAPGLLLLLLLLLGSFSRACRTKPATVPGSSECFCLDCIPLDCCMQYKAVGASV